MLYPVRRCPLCASLWLSVPLFCLWWYSCTLVPFGRLYGRFMAFCGVCRLRICRCGLLCGSVAAFYGVGVLFIGYGAKIALRGKYGRFTGCGVSRLCCACGILCRCGRLCGSLWAFCRCGCSPLPCAALRGSVELVRRSASGGRNKAPVQLAPGQRKSPDFSGRVVLFIHFQQFGKYYERENKNAK